MEVVSVGCVLKGTGGSRVYRLLDVTVFIVCAFDDDWLSECCSVEL